MIRMTLGALGLALAFALTTAAQAETAQQAYDRAFVLEHEKKDHAAAAAAYRKALAGADEKLALRCRVRLAACLLAQGKDDEARAALSAKAGGTAEAPKKKDDWEAALRKSLSARKVTLDFSATPLTDVVAFLSEVTQTAIVIDSSIAARAAGTKLTLRLDQLAVDKALSVMLHVHKLAWAPRCGAVVITDEAGLKRFPKDGPAGVPAKKLTLDFADTPARDVIAFLSQQCKLNIVLADDVLRGRKVTLRVKAHSLSQVLGLVAGQVAGTAEFEAGVVVIRDRTRARTRIAKGVVVDAPWARALDKSMQRKVTLDFNATPLRDVLNFLQDTSGVPIVVDSLASNTVATEKVSLTVRALPLDKALAMILDLKGLAYAPRCGAVVVSTGPGLAAFPVTAPKLDAKSRARKMTLNFADAPASDVIDFLRATGGINVVLAGEKLRAKKVTLRVKNLPMPQVFGLVTGLIGAKAEMKEGVLVISAR